MAKFRTVGSIASLWRYPVKSMLGEKLPAADISTRGVLGDRTWAIVDESNDKVASASRIPQLFTFRARCIDRVDNARNATRVRITLPGGENVTSASVDRDAVLSRAIGRRVRLQSIDHGQGDAAQANFFDVAAVHIITTATLNRLREHYPEGRFEPQRFRPNLLVDIPDGQSGFIEDDWIGKALAIGDDLRIKITGPCIRCVMTTLPQGDLPKDPRILRTATEQNETRAGVYASIITPGTVRCGDGVRLMNESPRRARARSS